MATIEEIMKHKKNFHTQRIKPYKIELDKVLNILYDPSKERSVRNIKVSKLINSFVDEYQK